MIRINQLKLPVRHTSADLERKIEKTLKVSPGKLKSWKIVRQSVDARHKEELKFIYSIDVEADREKELVRQARSRDVQLVKEIRYCFPEPGETPLLHRPVIVGDGPAGLFCGLMLARNGYCPIILERGERVEERTKRVAEFWETGVLNPSSNVQFGEGGAGTFSDGKLNTLVSLLVSRL